MKVNKRVEQLIEKVATNKAAFSAATGISAVILSHISSGRNKVSLSAITQILEAYPSINPNWLILGKGSMFVQENDNSQLLEQISNLEDKINANHKSITSSINALKQII